MPIQDYSIGRDKQVVVVHPLAPGGRLQIPNVTAVNIEPQYKEIRSDRLNGQVRHAAVPGGYQGTIELDRAGPELDDLQVLIEAAWRTAGLINSAEVFEYITEPDGSVSAYHYTNCAISFPNLGNWQVDAPVKQTIRVMADRKLRV